MKRAIKKKLKELRKDNLTKIDDSQDSSLFKMIDTHYFRSTVAFDSTNEDLRSIALQELKEFFDGLGETEQMNHYLLVNWYADGIWNLWGRRHPSKISFSRTTMKVEAHWSLMKRLYLLPYNRPRLDLLVHVIATSLMNKYKHDYGALKSGRKKPYWWKSFVSTWRQCANTAIAGNYITDTHNFICSCPAWLRSQFFICKHLVQGQRCPKYHEVTIKRSQPFIQISPESSRKTANVDDEELNNTNPSRSVLSISNICNPVDTNPVDTQVTTPFSPILAVPDEGHNSDGEDE